MVYSRPNIVKGLTRADKAFWDNILDGIDLATESITTVPLSTYVPLNEPSVYQGVTVTVSSSAPSWTAQYITANMQGTRFNVPGPPLVNDGSGAYYASWNGSDVGANVVSHEESFYLQGPKAAIMFYTYSDMDIQFLIDGQLAKPSYTVVPNAAGSVFVYLEFTDDTSVTKIRNIRAFCGQIGLLQWLLPAGGDMWADNTSRYTFGIVAADSFYHGANGTTEGSISAGTLAHELSIMTGGASRTINAGACGGTGYMNAATGTSATVGINGQTPFGSARRLAMVDSWIAQCDCIIVAGGGNDADFTVYPTASVVAAANACWNAYAAKAPGKPLIVMGVQSGPFQADNARLTTLNNALRAAALANPNVTAYINDRAFPLISGTGKISAKTGDGNADIMLCSDGVHLTRGGFRYYTRQRIKKMGEIPVPKVVIN